MGILDQTLPASFKGVSFLVDSASTRGGIKNAKHVFPNSSNQVIENLGTKQKSYSVSGFINNDPEVDDYSEKRDSLISVLDSGEKGVLIHPLFGTINNIICVDWTLSESFSQLGKASFSMNFEVDLSQSTPKTESNTASQVDKGLDEANEAVTEDVADNFAVTAFNNVSDAIEQVGDFVEAIEEQAQVFVLAAEKVNELSNQISDIANNVVDLIRAPLELAQSIENVFTTLKGSFATVEAAFGALAGMFGFGDDDVEINPTTSSLVERKKNRTLLNQAIQSYALANASQVASEIVFQTIQAQTEAADILEGQYDDLSDPISIIDLSGTPTQIGISTGTKDALSDQRIALNGLFDDNRVTIGRIIEIETVPTSSRLLSYSYYGNSTLGEAINSLNDIRDPAYVRGGVQVITQ